MSWVEALLGVQLRRVDAPFPNALALTLHGRELDGVLWLGLAREARGIGWLEQRPRGRVETPLLLRAKHSLEGGRIVAIARPSPTRLRFELERGGERFALELSFAGALGNATLRAADGTPLALLRPERDEDRSEAAAAGDEPELPALRTIGQRLLAAEAAHAFAKRRVQLERALKQTIRRGERRLQAIEADRARVDEAVGLRERASLLTAHLHALPRECTHAELLDYTRDPPLPTVIEIDRALGPKLQAQVWFQRARKLERGATLAGARAEKTRAELASLRELLASCATAADPAELDTLSTAAREAGVPDVDSARAESKSARGAKPERLPYREFRASGGRAIFVGRGPEDNDRLTLERARPEDLWLHVRDHAGAHVVVPLGRNEACPPELLCDAATLAAHFSQARGEAMIDVIYTPRRYVRKPRKAAPGLVSCLREKVFALELEPDRLKRLLDSELPR